MDVETPARQRSRDRPLEMELSVVLKTSCRLCVFVGLVSHPCGALVFKAQSGSMLRFMWLEVSYQDGLLKVRDKLSLGKECKPLCLPACVCALRRDTVCMMSQLFRNAWRWRTENHLCSFLLDDFTPSLFPISHGKLQNVNTDSYQLASELEVPSREFLINKCSCCVGCNAKS